MARETYQRQLADLRQGVLDLGELVGAQLARGIRALAEHDCELARKLDDEDDAIDERTVELEQACIDLVALQQPVAADMRLIVASLKIVTDLERVGDLAVNLGDYCCAAGRLEMIPPETVVRAGRIAGEMLRQALASYAAGDADAAAAVVARDQELDDTTWDAIRQFLKELYLTQREGHDEADAERISSQALPAMLSMRDLERVGDHAANIGARVFYLVSGSKRYL